MDILQNILKELEAWHLRRAAMARLLRFNRSMPPAGGQAE
jgi:hypothetical protein